MNISKRDAELLLVSKAIISKASTPANPDDVARSINIVINGTEGDDANFLTMTLTLTFDEAREYVIALNLVRRVFDEESRQNSILRVLAKRLTKHFILTAL